MRDLQLEHHRILNGSQLGGILSQKKNLFRKKTNGSHKDMEAAAQRCIFKKKTELLASTLLIFLFAIWLSDLVQRTSPVQITVVKQLMA